MGHLTALSPHHPLIILSYDISSHHNPLSPSFFRNHYLFPTHPLLSFPLLPVSKSDRIHKMTVEQLATVVFAPLDESNDSPKNSTKNSPKKTKSRDHSFGENSLGDQSPLDLSPEGTPKKEVKFLANGAQADSLYGAFERFDDGDDEDDDVDGLINSATTPIKVPTIVSNPTTTTITKTTTITTTATTIPPTTASSVIKTTTITPSKLAPLHASAAALTTPVVTTPVVTTPAPAPVPTIDGDTPGPDYEADFSDDDLYVEEEG